MRKTKQNQTSYKTYRFRIKDATSAKWLLEQSSKVNYVWNYCKEISIVARKRHEWLSGFDLDKLTKDSSKELQLPSATIQEINHQFAKSRSQHKKMPKWRSHKRHLGWIPFKEKTVRFDSGKSTVRFNKRVLRLWKSRELVGRIKSGSFAADSRGRWFVNFVCEVPVAGNHQQPGSEVGIDLGLKDKLSLSNGQKLNHPNLTKEFEDKLARAQRARKSRQVSKIHAKIRNSRLDWNHKKTTEIAERFQNVYVGGVTTSGILDKSHSSGMRKSLYDSSWHQLKNFLKYKAIALGGRCVEVSEAYTTQTCNVCGNRTGPKGQEGLSVREWKCDVCLSVHDRDTNAACNILRLGHQSLVAKKLPGIPAL